MQVQVQVQAHGGNGKPNLCSCNLGFLLGLEMDVLVELASDERLASERGGRLALACMLSALRVLPAIPAHAREIAAAPAACGDLAPPFAARAKAKQSFTNSALVKGEKRNDTKRKGPNA